MKKLLIIISLALLATSSIPALASAPSASGTDKESSEAIPYLSYVAYKATDALISFGVGYALFKVMGSSGNASAEKQNSASPINKMADWAPQGIKSSTRLSDVLGTKPPEFNALLDQIHNPKKYRNIQFPNGLIMHGAPGTGKTVLARALANELDATYFELVGSQFESKWVGEPTKKITQLFEAAREVQPTKNGQQIHTVIFIDELETIAPKRSDFRTHHHSKQTVGALLGEMTNKANEHIMVIGATNHKSMIDDALLRSGRFDIHIAVPLPDQKTRCEILKHYANNLPLESTLNIEELDKMSGKSLKKGYLKENPHLLTPIIEFESLAKTAINFCGADLKELCTKAARISAKRNSTIVQQRDFVEALTLMLKVKHEMAQ